MAIDNALSQSPADFEELLKLLREDGYEVSKRGKSYRLKLSGWEKAARMDSLGEGYGLEDLRSVLLGKKAHTPRKKTVSEHFPRYQLRKRSAGDCLLFATRLHEPEFLLPHRK